ncbi:GntR family transcriptional regulator [Streptomyces sp. NBC_01789]|uniref:GntR family transcriptional regulator n=1 Tax=Streptomyces sp. NBC_01789 TaxID=2975941 RepID=UPI0022515F42|nr:GntR family transcriptional regulator [Streptomyces sp. NBC_01789]MCX4451647.1 GntR family transcriptional regulator [Streptomyces sp. NBC_01789]
MPKKVGYAEIAAHFRHQIQEGTLRPGDAMPSYAELKEQFGVAHTTANRAYRTLKMEGLVLTSPGSKTVVSSPSSNNIGTRVALHATTGSALDAGESSHILEVGTVGADALVAPRLDVAPGTPVHVRRRVVTRADVPIHVSSSYYPAYVIAVAPELQQPVSTGASRELAVERLGVAQVHVLEEVTSRQATEAEKGVLGLTASSVEVTQVVRTVTLADGRVVEVAVKVSEGSTILRWATHLRAPESEEDGGA